MVLTYMSESFALKRKMSHMFADNAEMSWLLMKKIDKVVVLNFQSSKYSISLSN